MGFRLLSQQNIKVEIRNIKKLEITLKKKLKFNIIVWLASTSYAKDLVEFSDLYIYFFHVKYFTFKTINGLKLVKN